MNAITLEKRLDVLWESQLPFVVFRLPESKKVTIFFQDDKQLYTTTDFSESGFVMTSFENSEDYPFIPNSKIESFTKPSSQFIDNQPIVFPDSPKSKQEFVNLVEEAKEEIKKSTNTIFLYIIRLFIVNNSLIYRIKNNKLMRKKLIDNEVCRVAANGNRNKNQLALKSQFLV